MTQTIADLELARRVLRTEAAAILGLVDRIERSCLGLSQTPERGTKRDDLRPGLRTVGSRRRATILIEVRRAARQVVIHGIYYGGRSFEGDPDEA